MIRFLLILGFAIAYASGSCAQTIFNAATPGGSSGQLQYNNADAFGGSAATTTGAGTINVPSGQTYNVNGAQIASANLSDAANIAKLNGSPVFTSPVTISGASFGLSGAISGSGIFGTAGIRYQNVAATLTDTTSSGTVAVNYNDIWGGSTNAASSATTITQAFGAYFKVPVAGANVTFTNKWALGADSIAIGSLAGATGSNTAPALAIGAFGNGVYASSSSIVDISSGGTQSARFSANGWFLPISGGFFELSSAGTMSWGNGTAGSDTRDVFISRGGPANPQFGGADGASPVAQTISVQSATGTNAAGVNRTEKGSISTGSGVSGLFILQTGGTGAAAATQNVSLTWLTGDGSQHGTFGNTTNPPTCGTGCSSLSGASTDQRMTVTTGTAVTAITVNFGKTWANAPVCMVIDNSTVALASVSAVSTSAITVTTAAALTAAPVYILCG